MNKHDNNLRPGRMLRFFLILTMVLVAGCSTPADRMQQRLALLGDARLDSLMRGSLAATGGIENWARARRIEADALATIFEPDGAQTLVQQQLTVEPGEKLWVSLTSNEPGGVLMEQLDRKGKVQLHVRGKKEGAGASEAQQLRGTEIKLRLLAQALTGPAGLLREGYQLRWAGQERQGGRLTDKIEITGLIFAQVAPDDTTGNLMTVWIDAETQLMDRLWLCFRQEENKLGYLAVDMGDYRKVGSGLMLPGNIVIQRSDKYQQFRERRILLLENQRLEVFQKAKRHKLFLGLF